MRAEQWSISSYGSVTVLEAGTKFHKTARGMERIAVLLPFVALGKVFQSEIWAVEWKRLRNFELDSIRRCLVVERDWNFEARSFWRPLNPRVEGYDAQLDGQAREFHAPGDAHSRASC